MEYCLGSASDIIEGMHTCLVAGVCVQGCVCMDVCAGVLCVGVCVQVCVGWCVRVCAGIHYARPVG